MTGAVFRSKEPREDLVANYRRVKEEYNRKVAEALTLFLMVFFMTFMAYPALGIIIGGLKLKRILEENQLITYTTAK